MLAHGHTPGAVNGYTIGQVRAFMRAIERFNSERRIGDAVALRMAQAPGKAWKKYMKGLDGGE